MLCIIDITYGIANAQFVCRDNGRIIFFDSFTKAQLFILYALRDGVSSYKIIEI